MTYAHVKDNKTGVERTVMPKAYALIPKRYTLLGYVDENMNPVEGPSVPVKSARVEKKRVVEPAVSEPRKQMSLEEIEAKKAEMRAMNEAAIQRVRDEQAAKEAEKQQIVEKKKPGPKPKIKNEA